MKRAKKGLDSTFPKRGPGRPRDIDPVAAWGRAENQRGILRNVWERLSPNLLKAERQEHVVQAIQEAIPGESEFTPLAPLIFRVIKDEDFPTTPKGQISFLADSIAALGLVSFRRSRDICAEERARRKRAHKILRAELYIVCSCGYKGHSLNHACPDCGTVIPEWLIPGWSL